MTPPSPLAIEIWSDVACPWCHVGKRRLEAALGRFRARDAVELRWRSFELDPEAARLKDPGVPYVERLARKYATSRARAQDMIDAMTATAAAEGLAFRFDRIRPGNTFDAHRLLQLAAARGRADALEERFFTAYLSEGEPIGEPATLARLAAEAGLDPDEVRALLAGDAYAAEVRADEALARERGIRGVPFFLIDERLGLSGAQPAEVLLEALERAWSERAVADGATGGACTPEGCG